VLCGSNNRGAGTNDRSGRAFHYLGGSRAQPASVDLKLALDQEIGTFDKAMLSQFVKEVVKHRRASRTEREEADTI